MCYQQQHTATTTITTATATTTTTAAVASTTTTTSTIGTTSMVVDDGSLHRCVCLIQDMYYAFMHTFATPIVQSSWFLEFLFDLDGVVSITGA